MNPAAATGDAAVSTASNDIGAAGSGDPVLSASATVALEMVTVMGTPIGTTVP